MDVVIVVVIVVVFILLICGIAGAVEYDQR